MEVDRAVFDVWCELYPLMATGVVEAMPVSALREAMYQSPVMGATKSAEEVTAEMLPLVAACERRRRG